MIELESGTQPVHYLAGSVDQTLLFANTGGFGLMAKLGDLITRQKGGKGFLTLDEGDLILPPVLVQAAHTHVACLAQGGRMLVFGLDELKLQSNGGRGLTPVHELVYDAIESQYDVPDTGTLSVIATGRQRTDIPLAPPSRALRTQLLALLRSLGLLDESRVELVEFPNMISQADFNAKLKEHAPVHGVALGGTRFGDPETQVLMGLLDDDLLAVMQACTQRTLAQRPVRWANRDCLTVVMAASGYPDAPVAGDVIALPATLPANVAIFQAGTRRQDGVLYTAGGRVVSVTAWGQTVAAARDAAYAVVNQISFSGAHVRTDISLTQGQQ